MHVLNLAVKAIVEVLTTSGPGHWQLIRMPNTDQRRKLEEGTLAWEQVSGNVNLLAALLSLAIGTVPQEDKGAALFVSVQYAFDLCRAPRLLVKGLSPA